MINFQVLYLPSWFPGMSLKKRMAEARVLSERYVEQPFQYSLQKEVRLFQLLTLYTP